MTAPLCGFVKATKLPCFHKRLSSIYIENSSLPVQCMNGSLGQIKGLKKKKAIQWFDLHESEITFGMNLGLVLKDKLAGMY